MELSVRDNPAENRYEVHADGVLAGFAAYQLHEPRITFTHTEVGDEFGGHGVGSTLARGALDDVRRRGLTVIPLCPFIKGYIAKHLDDYLDLVDERLLSSFSS
jgi:uncharacterized protein